MNDNIDRIMLKNYFYEKKINGVRRDEEGKRPNFRPYNYVI